MGWKMGLLRDDKIDEIRMIWSEEEEEELAADSAAGSLDVGVPDSPAYSTRKRTALPSRGIFLRTWRECGRM